LLNSTLGTEILDGCELQPEAANLALARQQAPGLEEAIQGMSPK
jgi:hypothetical protein